jgi:hypothetical protein
MFGEPGVGAHKYRFGGLAAVDVAATCGGAYLLSRYALGQERLAAHILMCILLFAVAVGVHEAFCVNTRLNATIFSRPWPARTRAAFGRLSAVAEHRGPVRDQQEVDGHGNHEQIGSGVATYVACGPL